MPDPEAYIGSVTFRGPLGTADNDPTVVMGSDIRVRSGDLVTQQPVNTSQRRRNVKYFVDWISYSDLKTLEAYWLSGSIFNADLEATGTTQRVSFARKDGVANPKHVKWGDRVAPSAFEGYKTDIWACELNLILEDESE